MPGEGYEWITQEHELEDPEYDWGYPLSWNYVAKKDNFAETKDKLESPGGGVSPGTIPGGTAGRVTGELSPWWEGTNAFAGSIWDNVKLYDRDDAAANYDNLRADGYGAALSIVMGIGAAVGERIGVGNIEDARSGRDINGEQLSGLARAGRGTLGLGQLTLEAIGLKGVPGAVRGAKRKLTEIFFPKTAATKIHPLSGLSAANHKLAVDVAAGRISRLEMLRTFTPDEVNRAAHFFRQQANSVSPHSKFPNAARLFNEARARFIEQGGPQPPISLPEFMRIHGLTD